MKGTNRQTDGRTDKQTDGRTEAEREAAEIGQARGRTCFCEKQKFFFFFFFGQIRCTHQTWLRLELTLILKQTDKQTNRQTGRRREVIRGRKEKNRDYLYAAFVCRKNESEVYKGDIAKG